MDSAFHFIALIFSDKSYQELFYTIMAVSLFFAGAASYFRFLQGRQEGNILTWAGPVLIAFVLFLAFVKPKGEVTVYDKVLNKQDTISGIPIGITTIAGLTSAVGDGILQIIDTTAINPDLSYENSAGGVGVLTIYNAVTHSLGIDANFDRSMRRYIEDCYFFCLEAGNCNLAELEDSTDLLIKQLANAASSSVYTVYYDNSNPQGKDLTCQEDWNNYLRGTLNNTTSYQNIAKEICEEAGINANSVGAFQHCLDITEAYLQKLYNGQYPSVTDSVYTYLEQDYIARQVYLASVMSGTTLIANNEIMTRGYSLGMTMNSWVPTIRGVLIAFGLSLLPFLILFLPTPFFKKILSGVAAIFLFMISWLIVDAVIHFFLVHQAATYFSSVYTAHNIGYASFLMMSSPLAKALAVWGYLRSLGIGLAAMITAGVTKVGAYGLQQMAAGIEAGVDAGAFRGKESIDATEQGKLEEEIINSNAFRGIAGGYSYVQMKQMLEKEMGKRLGSGAAYKSPTGAFETAKNAESIQAGMINAEAKTALDNGMTTRQYGWNKGIENATADVNAWKSGGGAHNLGVVEGINKGAGSKGELDAVHGRPQELENLIRKQSAYQTTGTAEKFRSFSRLMHREDNEQTAEELAELQGRNLQGLSFSPDIAHRILGSNAPGGLYNVTVDKNGKVLQATVQNGVNISEVTPAGLRHIAMTNKGKVALIDEKGGYRFDEGARGQISGDIGKYAYAVGMPQELARALSDANGTLQIHGKQYSGTVTLRPEEEIGVADVLSQYGDKYKNTVKTLRWAADRGYAVDFSFTGVGDSLSKAEVDRIDYGRTVAATQTVTGSGVRISKDFDTALANHDWKKIHQLIKNVLKNSPDKGAAIAALGEHMVKFFGAYFSVNKGLSFSNTVGVSGHDGKSYYEDHNEAKIKSVYHSGNIGSGASFGSKGLPEAGMFNEKPAIVGASFGMNSGYETRNTATDTVGHRADSGSRDTYSSATTNTYSTGTQLTSNVFLRDFIQKGDEIIKKGGNVDEQATELTKLIAGYDAMFTNGIVNKNTIEKFDTDARVADSQTNFDALDIYANKYKDPFWQKQEDVLDSLGTTAQVSKPEAIPQTPNVDSDHPSVQSDVPKESSFSVNMTNSQASGNGLNFGDFKVRTPEKSKNEIGEILSRINKNSSIPQSDDQTVEINPSARNDEDMTPSQSR